MKSVITQSAALLVALDQPVWHDNDRLVKVQGVVTLDGNPLEGASVTFMPSQLGRPASGFSDAKGRFELTTNEPDDGVPTGHYKVLISKNSTADGLDEMPDGMTEDHPDFVLYRAYQATTAISVQLDKVRNLVPEFYSNIETTPFSCDVPPPTQPVEFALESDAGELYQATPYGEEMEGAEEDAPE